MTVNTAKTKSSDEIGPSLFTVDQTLELDARDRSPHEALLRKTRLLMEVNQLAIDLNEADPADNLAGLICERMRESLEAVCVSLSRYDSEAREVFVRHFSCRDGLFAKLTSIFRRDLRDVRYTVSEDAYKRWLDKRIEAFSEIYDLTLGAIPRSLCVMAQKALGIGKCYAIVLRQSGEPFGIMTICMPKRAPDLPLDVLEAMSNMLAASLNRLETQQALNEYRSKLQSLALELTRVEEKERRRLAAIMHDEVTQTLGLMGIRLGLLSTQPMDPKTEDLIGEMSELLEASIQKTRTLTFELSSPILYELGLLPAVRWLCRQMEEQHGIPCRCTADGDEPELSEELRVVAFQAVRELLLNIRKHAEASRVEVECLFRPDDISITIADDGRGFDPNATPRNNPNDMGFGLFYLRERFSHLGGCVGIDAAPGKGSRIVLTIPLNVHEKGHAQV